MLRSKGFRRPAYERKPSTPIAMKERRGVVAQVADVVVASPKGARVIDETYRRWVASLPCIACGVHGYSQAAHPNQGRGLGQKADDTECFPLCCTRPGVLGCHVAFDRLVSMSLDERRAMEITYTEQTRLLWNKNSGAM